MAGFFTTKRFGCWVCGFLVASLFGFLDFVWLGVLVGKNSTFTVGLASKWTLLCVLGGIVGGEVYYRISGLPPDGHGKK